MTDHLEQVWSDRSDIQIVNIIPEDGESISVSEITFDANGPGGTTEGAFAAPTISVDTSARYAVHEIVGGTTIRQKMGQDPMEIEVAGVCDEKTARNIDELRKAKVVTLMSESLQERCQVAATSTSPMSESHPVDASTGALLYSYDISLVGLEG